MRKKILFICGSINQTKQMHEISLHMTDAECFFTPYYCDGVLEAIRRQGMLDFTILGAPLRGRTLSYLEYHGLPVDHEGQRGDYDLVVTCSDLIVPKNIRKKKIVLVQEGMTDPEDFLYHLVRTMKILPRWFASTSMTGLSHQYERFCVASEGYRDLFIRKGVRPEKIVVTGIPNFDNCRRLLNNGFPLKHYVLVCTSDSRETFRYENRRRFIRMAVAIAKGRQLIFKLHPNEQVGRAEREIACHAPGAIVFTDGNTDEMIANCEVLITRYSTTVYVGLALGKECYSEFDMERLHRLLPVQSGTAAQDISKVCRSLLEEGAGGRRSQPLVRRRFFESLLHRRAA